MRVEYRGEIWVVSGDYKPGVMQVIRETGAGRALAARAGLEAYSLETRFEGEQEDQE